jgi:hypothetical protein
VWHYKGEKHRERRTEAKTDSYSNDRIFQKLKYIYWKFGSFKVLSLLKLMGESSAFTTRKEICVLVNLDRFLKFIKYFKYFEKRSKLTKNSNFFARGERAKLSHHFEPS